MKIRKQKCSKNDFTYSDLPHTRFEVFKRLFLKRFSTLFIVGLLTFIFFIPLIGFNFFSNFIIRSINLNNLTQEIVGQLFSASFLRATISIPLFGIAGIGIGCLIHFLQHLAWDEITFISDYFFPIKKNWLKFVLIGILIGISFGIFIFIVEFCAKISSFTVSIIGSVFGTAQLIFFSIFYLQILIQNEIYKNKLGLMLINSFKFSLIGFLPFTGIMIFIIYPCIGILFNSMLLDIICIFLIIFNFSPSFLSLILYSNSLYDKTINLDHYPDIYDKGVYRDF